MSFCAIAIDAAKSAVAIAQNDIKKVLAYSTVSQLGFMFLAAGVGAFTGAIFHVMTHAFFKALLFLGSGSVIIGMHHEQDMRKMGNLRKYMPVTFITMAVGWLAIAGIPFFSGFFSKDEILYRTFAADNYFPNGPFPGEGILWFMAAFAAILTAVYMTRMMVMTFWGSERYHDEIPGEQHAAHDDDHHALPADFKPHESSWVMTLPLIVLAVLAAVGGLVGIPHSISSLPVVSSIVGEDANRFEHVLEPVIAKAGEDAHAAETAHGTEATHAESTAAAEHSADAISTERWLAVVSTILAIIGIAIGWFAFIKTPLRKMPKILEEKWRLDEIYNGLIVDPITRFSTNGLWKGVDAGFIDGSVNGIGALVSEVARSLKGLQIGYIRSYAAMVVLGAVVVIGYFIYYGLKLIGS